MMLTFSTNRRPLYIHRNYRTRKEEIEFKCLGMYEVQSPENYDKPGKSFGFLIKKDVSDQNVITEFKSTYKENDTTLY